jgi:pimeloyl-ACP methyl ester carboxylesterase
MVWGTGFGVALSGLTGLGRFTQAGARGLALAWADELRALDPVRHPKLVLISVDEWFHSFWGRGSHCEFVIEVNLTSVEYAARLPSIKVPTLITVGDHDECAPSLSKEMNSFIPGSKLVALPQSGHMTFVNQPRLFIEAVQNFPRRMPQVDRAVVICQGQA